jgi:hypothetical protein
MNGTSRMSAWRWLFILEGLPSLLSAVAVFFFLPDYPETSSWLTTGDKRLAADRLRLEGSHGQSGHMTWADAKATLLDVRLYAHYIVSCPYSLYIRTITHWIPDLLWHLYTILLSLALHTNNHGRSRLLWSASTAYDSASLRLCLCRHNYCGVVCGSLQRSCSPFCCLRHNWCPGLPRFCCLASTRIRLPIRLLDRCSEWFIQLHPASARLAEQQSVLNCSSRPGDRYEHLVWSTRSDRWCLDIQSQ